MFCSAFDQIRADSRKRPAPAPPAPALLPLPPPTPHTTTTVTTTAPPAASSLNLIPPSVATTTPSAMPATTAAFVPTEYDPLTGKYALLFPDFLFFLLLLSSFSLLCLSLSIYSALHLLVAHDASPPLPPLYSLSPLHPFTRDNKVPHAHNGQTKACQHKPDCCKTNKNCRKTGLQQHHERNENEPNEKK